MHIVDTNVLDRFIAGDDPDHSPRTIAFFDRIYSGDIQALLMDGVIVEATQVLSSDRYFAGSRETIAEGLRRIIGLHGMTVQNRVAHPIALEIFAVSKLDCVDCLLMAMVRMGAARAIASFDRDFDAFEEITRIEP